MIKVIAFDLDNTIFDEWMYFNAICKKQNINIEISKKRFHQLRKYSSNIIESILKENDSYSLEKKNIFFSYYMSIKLDFLLHKKKYEFFDVLKEKYKTCILTNGIVKVQTNKLQQLDLKNRFSKIFYARENGKKNEKPCSYAFKKILDMFDCLASEVVFIGDNPITDIQGANKIGMKTILSEEFTQFENDEIQPNYKIKSIFEIERILKKL